MSNFKENEPKFFVDAMLGNIAKKLRLLGFDTKYSSDIEDNSLLDIARKEKRIIISKDLQLIRKSQKLKVAFILLSNQPETDQLVKIFVSSKQKNLRINGDVSRCPKCNFQTIPISKEDVSKNIPKNVLEINEKFWRCENCDQIYWEGTHIKKLQEEVDKINERL